MCFMHTQELVLKHALGLVNRSVNKKIVDSFSEGKNLCDLCKSFASKVMDKKQKQRLTEYNSLSLQTYKVLPCRLLVPNETRVSGVFTLMTSLLHAKSLLKILQVESEFLKIYRDYVFDNNTWKLISEFQAVMTLTDSLARSSQTNESGEIAFSWFEVSIFRSHLVSRSFEYSVVDCSKSWPPNTAIDKILIIPMNYSAFASETRTFIDRLIKEVDFYFPSPDLDQLMAMKLHPVFQSLGMS